MSSTDSLVGSLPLPFLLRALDRLVESVIITDADGAICFWNDGASALYGFTSAEAMGRQLDRLILAPGRRADADTSMPTVAADAAGASAASRQMQHRNGTRFPVAVSTTRVLDSFGRLTHVIDISADATPREAAPAARTLAEIASSSSDAERRLESREALFLALGRRASDVAMVVDEDTRIVYVSASITEIFGYATEDLIGRVGQAMIHPDDISTLQRAMERVLAEPTAVATFTTRIRDVNGRWRWVEQTLSNFLHDPSIGGLVANLRDVTNEYQALEDLRQSEARYRAIAETAQEGILVLSPSGVALFVNQTLADLIGMSLADTYRQSTRSLFDAETAQALDDNLRRQNGAGTQTYEIDFPHPDGTKRRLSLSAAPLPLPDSVQSGSLIMISDVTEARHSEDELRRLALHDPLTGLPNRALLIRRLEIAAARAVRNGCSVAIVFLDLDQFRQVNDSRGHESGDTLLIEVAARLQVGVRPADTVARIGGDEFAILCEDIDEAGAVAVADRVRGLLRRPIDVHGHRVYVDASMGIAMSPPHDSSALMRFADAAMYEAKYEGRGRVKVYDPAVAIGADRKLAVATALREALDSDVLVLHYQPIIDIASGEMEGVEALLRWTDDKLGKVSPDEIVLAVEERGMSFELDQWVLHRACRDMAALAADGQYPGLYLAVNVSARNIAGADFRHLVDDTVAATGWAANRLTLEVTESAIMADPESARASLATLRAEGVAIAIDDFGTGYSSLAYLRRLPVSVLKIDRSFVDQVDVDAESLAIARSIIELAGALGLRTVAEGIETKEQAAIMLGLGCATGQGYLWSQAVPPAELAGLADRHRAAAASAARLTRPA